MKELPRVGPIGVKRMGELDNRPFHEAMKRSYNESEADERATELCSLWEEYLRDPGWHPIKVVMVNGKPEVCFSFTVESIVFFSVFLTRIMDSIFFKFDIKTG